MKVVLVGDYPEIPGEITGGVEAVVEALANGLYESSFCDVHVVTLFAGNEVKVSKNSGVTVHFLPKTKLLPNFLAYWTLNRWRLKSYLSRINPDVVHFQGLSGQSIGYRGKAVCTIHGLPELDVLYSDKSFKRLRSKVIFFAEKIGRKRDMKFISINPYVKESIPEISEKVHDIDNPVDEIFFTKGRQQSSKKIVVVGRVNARKNALQAIEIFNLLQEIDPELVLHFVGALSDVEYVKTCKSRCASLRLSDKVFFEGNKNRQELLDSYSSALFLLSVSNQETAPMAISEAMAVGVPIVSVDVGGVRHMFEHGKHGLIVDMSDLRYTAECIYREIVINEMGWNRHDISYYAKSRYSLRVVVRKTLEVYAAC
jgi:glycosyltransferase involved in cell wall biosynthesis